jgi:hypothetical protein
VFLVLAVGGRQGAEASMIDTDEILVIARLPIP